MTIPAGVQISLRYIFVPDAMLEPKEYGLSARVFYQDAVCKLLLADKLFY
jgi:hypothetical protein